NEMSIVKVKVGIRPNGLAYDPGRNLLLVANVGDPAIPGSFRVSLVDVEKKAMVSDLAVAGRTRWAVYDAASDACFGNIADSAHIAVTGASRSTRVIRGVRVPAA